MVKADVGDDAKLRTDYICAVKPPAKPGLYDREIHPRLGEPPEGHRSGNLKKRQPELVESRPPLCAKLPDIFAWDKSYGGRPGAFPGSLFQSACSAGCSARAFNHTGPLSEIQQVRGSVKCCAVAHCGEGRGEHIADRPLSVGAGNVNGAEFRVRKTKPRVKLSHRVKSRVIRHSAHRLVGGEANKKPLNQSVIFCVTEFYFHNKFSSSGTLNTPRQQNAKLTIYTVSCS